MATTLVSVDEYLRTSYPDGHCEYGDGEIVERNLGEIDHASLHRIITVPPHLVVEVLSPDDRAGATQQEIDDYLAFGIPYVWVVNPETGRGYVHTAEAAREAKDGILRTADPATELPLHELLGK